MLIVFEVSSRFSSSQRDLFADRARPSLAMRAIHQREFRPVPCSFWRRYGNGRGYGAPRSTPRGWLSDTVPHIGTDEDDFGSDLIADSGEESPTRVRGSFLASEPDIECQSSPFCSFLRAGEITAGRQGVMEERDEFRDLLRGTKLAD